MLTRKFQLSLSLALCATVGAATLQAKEPVDYPEDYRDWTHVKSMVIEPGHALANPFQGIHHIYANPKARKGYKKGDFPEGSVIVFDLLQYDSKDHAKTESDRKLIGVMKKDKRYKATGGWAFQAFKGDSETQKLVDDGGKSCFGCHASKKNQDFVFSSYRP